VIPQDYCRKEKVEEYQEKQPCGGPGHQGMQVS
jgi:hypothetical protein